MSILPDVVRPIAATDWFECDSVWSTRTPAATEAWCGCVEVARVRIGWHCDRRAGATVVRRRERGTMRAVDIVSAGLVVHLMSFELLLCGEMQLPRIRASDIKPIGYTTSPCLFITLFVAPLLRHGGHC